MTTQLLIDPGLFSAVARLSTHEQAAVMTFINEFYKNPAQPGIQLHTIAAARSKGLWSGRVNQDLRVILHKDGDTWVLLHVDHHDPAYRWAERRDVGRHPVTGALQIVESVETIREIERVVHVEPAKPPIFPIEKQSDSYLLSLGIPENWLPTLRTVTDDDEQLASVVEKLPADVALRIIDLAAGKLVTPPAPLAMDRPLTDSTDTRSQFYVVEDAAGLTAALAAPLDRWIAFLHPSQREVVEAAPRGPVKVSGSAGTGKTVVLLHRARYLSRRGQRVLLTSFVSTLCENLQRNLRKLCTPDELSRITVSTVHKQALDLVRKSNPKLRVAQPEETEALLDSLRPLHAANFEESFVRSEWESVIQQQGLRTWDEYRAARRTGRGRGLSVSERKDLWRLFGEVYNRLDERSLLDFASLCRRAESLLTEGKIESPYQAVLIDEVQDLKPAELRFAKALCAANAGQLLLAGDTGQRIYPGGFTLNSLGIDVRGRSHTLRINYRTTEQIRRLADRVLGEAADDMDGERESRRGTRSLLRGPHPALRGFGSAEGENEGIVVWLRERFQRGLQPAEVACFARTARRIEELRAVLGKSQIESQLLSENDGNAATGLQLGTMHRAKGLEYKAVVVLDCGEGSLPSPTALRGRTDPLDREQAEERERQLLYVAMTRARDELLLTWNGEVSRFLQNLVTAEAKK